jgi:hypothetical protein
MKRFLFTFLAALCAISANAQIIKTLGYATNGQIVAATNVVWTNSFGFSTNTVAAQVRTNLLLGWSALTNTNATNFRASIGLGWAALTNTNAAEALLGYTTNGNIVYTGTNTLTFTNNIYFTYADITFTASGLSASGTIVNFEEKRIQDVNTGDVVSWSGEETIEVWRPINFGTNAATTRTNLGLGGGITTNRTFVSYNGTNYTTNSVTISNGIITGWTQ